jgi:hypothetical protein
MPELIELQKKVARPRTPWIRGTVPAGSRAVPAVSTRLSRADVLGGWKVRWDIGRMSYRVAPGLYAAGRPTAESPVLVTANYKLTFDSLRRELGGMDTWILALETRGINVWCAAGKGTFGTRELVQRIAAVKLGDVVTHRTLILPQLGATGVSAHQVREQAGWRVKFGPVRAEDIPAYLAAGMKKDDEMRRVRFRLGDRMAIAPAELSHAWPFMVAALVGAALLGLPWGAGYAARALAAFLPLLGSVLMGTILFPALLPILPFRAFSLRGAVLGAAWSALAAAAVRASLPEAAGLVLAGTAVTSFLAMNFTGSSTFTCLPGAALEVRRGLVPIIAAAVLGAGLLAAARIFNL